MIEDFFNALKEFSENDPYIESVIIVGSYARGKFRFGYCHYYIE